jgi:amino acid transporter
MNEPEIVIPELRQKFSVRELLDGIEELSARMQRHERNLDGRRFPQHMPEEIQPKPHPPAPPPHNSPWRSGSFYLVSYVVAIATILIAIIVLNKYGVSWTTGAFIPLILIGGILSIGIIGANQLKNDGQLSDESYVKLMIESYKRLPLLRGKGESHNLAANKQKEG